MDQPTVDTRSLVIERDIPHPPEKLWRALTQPALIEDWLMRNDFAPVPGHRFNFRTDPMPHWNGVVDCEVLAVEPVERLSYSWGTTSGLSTVVTFTLKPTATGTHLKVEQSGFTADQDANHTGANYGWQKFLGSLERVVETLS